MSNTNPKASKGGQGFAQLFWAARKEHTKLKENAKVTSPTHRAAITYAQAQAWPWAEELVEASRLVCSGKTDEALRIIAGCQNTVTAEFRGYVHFVRGSALAAKGNHDEAVKTYRMVFDDPNFDKPAYVWHNLGRALFLKGDHKEAIKAYRQALADPSFDRPGNSWNGLGIALAAIGDHAEAIKAYRKALTDPKYDNPAYAWNNLGVEFAAMSDYAEAIKAYRKALADPKYDNPANAWVNLALSYVKAGKSDLAREAFKKVLAAPDKAGSDYARARSGLQVLESKLKPSALSPDDRALVEKSLIESSADDPEGRLIAAIQEAGDTQYDKYLDRPDSKRDNTLSILRGWSSAVTLLEGSERRWRGGGYFLKWRGCGIVIDPGFDFLRNFHDAGYHGREIRAVLVSHNHPDHNSDLKDIDDLRYELYKRLVGKKDAGSEPYVLLWDQDTAGATKFPIEAPKHIHEPIVFTSGFPQPIHLGKHAAKLPVRITPFKVNNGNDVQHAMGMVVELLDKKGKTALRIGYTADTAYFKDLPRHLAHCDVLIAHISQPSIEELRDASKLKEVHLGYRGTVRLLKECQPKLALIGEFWAGFTDLRIGLVKGLRQRSGCEHVMPAGLAMHIKLPSLEIECTECGAATPFAETKVAPPTDNFGDLSYLCPKCLLG